MLARHLAGLLLAGLTLAAAIVPAQAAVSVADVLRAVEAGHYAWARAKAEEAGGALLEEYVDWRELRDATPLPGFKRFRSFLAGRPAGPPSPASGYERRMRWTAAWRTRPSSRSLRITSR
jgi:hypothetical protein